MSLILTLDIVFNLFPVAKRYIVKPVEKIDGIHVQKLKIHYNCVGSIEIPDVLPLPEPDVLIQTRKGVAVSYSAQKAV
jgi:hypothetical protein